MRGIYKIEYAGVEQAFIYHYTQEELRYKTDYIPKMDFFTGWKKGFEFTISRKTIENILENGNK